MATGEQLRMPTGQFNHKMRFAVTMTVPDDFDNLSAQGMVWGGNANAFDDTVIHLLSLLAGVLRGR